MKVLRSPQSSNTHRHLLMALIACPVVFASTFLYAIFTGYPSWMWYFVMAGLFLPPVVAVVTVVMLIGEARWTRAAA
jgi:cation transporter-like permease